MTPATGKAQCADIARLGWQCRRGMRELDELLLGFLKAQGAGLDGPRLCAFESLLSCPDAVLLELLMGRMQASDTGVNEIAREIRLTGCR